MARYFHEILSYTVVQDVGSGAVRQERRQGYDRYAVEHDDERIQQSGDAWTATEPHPE